MTRMLGISSPLYSAAQTLMGPSARAVTKDRKSNVATSMAQIGFGGVSRRKSDCTQLTLSLHEMRTEYL